MKIRRSQPAPPRSAPANAVPACPEGARPGEASPEKKAVPGARRTRFVPLTLGLLAGSGLCLFALAQWIIRPDLQVGSFAALPAYNVVGQQTDWADFWARAQYHNATPQTPIQTTPLFALDALSRIEQLFPLDKLLYSRTPGTLTVPDTSVKSAWYHTNTFQLLTCTFWDDVPAIYSTHSGRTYPGCIELSLGRSVVNEQQPLCFTLLFLPGEAPDEQAFEAAYSSVVDDLQQLCAGKLNSFHTLEDLLGNLDPAAFEGEPGWFAPLQARNLTGLAGQMSSLLLELYLNGSFPYDLADPAQADALLQEYFRERSCALQILRLEDCYLVLISTEQDSGTATLGLYYSPVLKTWCGIGLQLM